MQQNRQPIPGISASARFKRPIPGTTSAEWIAANGFAYPTALGGIMLFSLLFILPIAAVMSRVCYKKTGSAWLGGFLTTFVVLTFTISHMVISIM